MTISKSQLFWMIFISEIVLLTYFALGPSLKQAKQDIWITYFLAGGGAAIGSFLMVKVSLLQPNKTIMEYSQLILGKWLGKPIALAYICFWFFIMMIMLHGTVDFIKTNLLYQTPAIVIMLLEIVLMLYFNLAGGITTIGRSSQVIGPLLFIAAFLPLLLNSHHMDLHQLLPVYEEGEPIVKGALIVFCFAGETSVIMMIAAFMKDTNKAVSSVMNAIGFGTMWGVLMSVAVILVFGPISAADMYHPQFMYMKSISILNFIQNFDLVITFFLQFGIMIKLAYHLFISSYGMAQLLRIRNWHNVTWSMAVLLFICMLLTSDLSYEFYIKPWIFLIFNLAIPCLLWAVQQVKRTFT
ncbi:spore germination protein KB [Paenibacillus sp. UNC496MF]|uniref:GerAB/ArcD/ProY family transporter n=1 Tax=Paenibacillus sp. UNC496MF TaxID=1502753 RepID=UPI0008E8F471|nr:endospore germination permease [Paenibacillus sp. UNC496MF]SFJ59171.1 spore germination protein KB [Paenibacillus sp. UNC496MF]